MINVLILDDSQKEVAKAYISAPGSRKFYLDAGKYEIHYHFPEEIKLELGTKDCKFLVEQKFRIKIQIEHIPGKPKNVFRAFVCLEPQPKVSVPIITMAAVSITAIGNVTTLGSAIIPKPPVPSMPSSTNALFTPGKSIASNPFSSEVEQRLLACFKVNFKNFVNVPDTADFVKLYLENGTLTSELAMQLVRMVEFYEKYTKFRTTIKKCDPTLWQALVSETKQAQAYPASVIINTSVVNVRSGPSVDSEIIQELLYDDQVNLHTVRFSALSEHSKMDLLKGNGWYPVSLSQGRNGYINSKYVRFP